MNVPTIVEAVTHPNVAVPVTTVGTLASVLAALPHVVMCGWVIYLLLLISHKGWQMYKEWRDDPKAPFKGWFK